MARRRSRIDGLKAPFVVTMTVTATGCGGTVTDGNGRPEISMNPPGQGTGGAAGAAGAMGAGGMGTGGFIQNPPAPFEPCPPAQPNAGDSCYVDPSATCTFGGGPCELQYYARCQAGTWVVTSGPSGSSCNPPPPPPPVETTCPTTVPAGGYCNYQGPPCGYGPMCGSYPTQTATCVNNVWMMSISSCNPPPPTTTTCPTVAPASGTYCNYAGFECLYGCDVGLSAKCAGFQWSVSSIFIACDGDGGSPVPVPEGGPNPLPGD